MSNQNVAGKARRSIVATVISAAIASCSLSLIPLTSGYEEGKSNIVAYLIAASFWAGLLSALIAAYITKRILYKQRKAFISDGTLKKNQWIGIVHFSKSRKMWILYGMTVVGLALIVTDIILAYIPETIMFPIVSLTMLSFAIHCVLDGKYYKTYQLMKEKKDNGKRR